MEIKFRGICLFTGKLIVGYGVCVLGETAFIINKQGNNLMQHSPVIFETLGQFTGKKDKHGKDVYVGDKSKDGGVIEWYQDTCQFVIKMPGVAVQELKDCENWLELDGNIHDKN